MARITAYIPAYNVSEYLARTIEGLLAQTHPFDEILVIDDGSRDNSAEIASRYPQVTLIKHPVNRGLAAARNTAIRAARNELVASVDADVVADPNWITTLLPHLDDPKVAGAGGILIEGVQSTLGRSLASCPHGSGMGPAIYPQSAIPLWLQQRIPEVRRAWKRVGTTNRCAPAAKTRILPSGSALEAGIWSTIPRLAPRTCVMTT